LTAGAFRSFREKALGSIRSTSGERDLFSRGLADARHSVRVASAMEHETRACAGRNLRRLQTVVIPAVELRAGGDGRRRDNHAKRACQETPAARGVCVME